MKLALIPLLLFMFSCQKDGDIVFKYDPPVQPLMAEVFPTKDLIKSGDIDILWVVDNSGSMDSIQQNVISNAKIFMEEFAAQKHINWKMGIVSTDEDEKPYLGFDSTFDYSLIDHSDSASLDRVVETFQKSFRELGTRGSGSEYVFLNAYRHIKDYDGSTTNPSFLRSNSHLAVIMVSDEEEQSRSHRALGSMFGASAFLSTMSSFIGSGSILRFYSALQASDLKDCPSTWGGHNYVGSPYEEVVSTTSGFNISACSPDFGVKLAEIGQDIASLVDLPSLLLGDTPEVHSIRVFYNGTEIPGGPKEKGGMWFYTKKFNTIQFYDIGFIKDMENDNLSVDFEIDDGNVRPNDPDNPSI